MTRRISSSEFEKMPAKEKKKLEEEDLKKKEPDVDKPSKKIYGCGTCSMMYATKEENNWMFQKDTNKNWMREVMNRYKGQYMLDARSWDGHLL